MLLELLEKLNISIEDFGDTRIHPREQNKKNLNGNVHYPAKFKLNNADNDLNLKILFAHFSPFTYEMEGLGFPFYVAKKLPNSTIHFGYCKGSRNHSFYNVSPNNRADKIPTHLEKYDIIIGRSSVFFNLSKNLIKNSDLKVNLKTMSLASNIHPNVDYHFAENEFFPIADPTILKLVDKYKNIKKEKVILLSGSIWPVKGQEDFIRDVNPDLIKDYMVVLAGGFKNPSSVKNIKNTIHKKNLKNIFLTNFISRDLLYRLFASSPIQVIPFDGRKTGQPEGFPRVLAEGIPFKNINLCSKMTTVPKEFLKVCNLYDNDSANSLNTILEKTINSVSSKKDTDWPSISFEDMCDRTLNKCITLLNEK